MLPSQPTIKSVPHGPPIFLFATAQLTYNSCAISSRLFCCNSFVSVHGWSNTILVFKHHTNSDTSPLKAAPISFFLIFPLDPWLCLTRTTGYTAAAPSTRGTAKVSYLWAFKDADIWTLNCLLAQASYLKDRFEWYGSSNSPRRNYLLLS